MRKTALGRLYLGIQPSNFNGVVWNRLVRMVQRHTSRTQGDP